MHVGTRRRVTKPTSPARAFRVQVSCATGGGRVRPIHARFTADGDAVRMPKALPLVAMLALLPLAAACSPHAQAEARLQPAQHARVALVADHAAVKPGQSFMAGLRIIHDAGWHTYWSNSGDSGLATRYAWTLPADAQAGDIRWPFPERLPFGPLTNFGYSGDLLLPAALSVPAAAKPGERFRASLRARWLICADTCIPDEATLTLDLPIADEPRPSREAAIFRETLDRVPTPLRAAQGRSWRDATHVATQIDGADFAKDAARIEVFPLTPQVVASTAIDARLGADGALRFRQPASDAFDAMPARIGWVIGVHRNDGTFDAVQISLPGEDARAR